MLMYMESRQNFKPGHVGKKTRSLGKILEKVSVHIRRHSFEHNFMKLIQDVHLHKSRTGLELDHVRSKTRLLDQSLEKNLQTL